MGMRRPLLCGAALYGLGCLVSDGEAAAREALVLLLLAGTLLALAALTSERGAALALGAAAVALGAAGAQVEVRRYEAGPLRRRVEAGEWVSRPVRIAGVLRGDVRTQVGPPLLEVDVASVEADGRTARCSGRVRVEVGGESAAPELVVGEPIAVWASLRPASSPGGARTGVAAYGYCKSARLMEVLARPSPLSAGWLRARARAALVRWILPGPERGLVLAMVLGDRSEIDPATAEAFRASGTYHVLALSGAQVALVAGLIAVALRRLRAAPHVEALVTTAAIAFYAALVGGDVPVVRAALMAGAVLAGRALEVDTDTANLLGLAAFILLVARPADIFDVGFQLSFGATLGILVFVGTLTRGLPRLPLRAELALTASVAAQAALAPLLATHFHRLAPGALALNLAAVPLSGAVLLAGLAVLAAAALGATAAQLAADVAWAAAHALRLSGDLGPLARWLDVRVPSPSLLLLAVHLAGLALLLRGRRARGLALVAASQLALAFGPSTVAADGRLHLAVLNVGEGDSLYLQSPRGRVALVDAGGSRDARFDTGERMVGPELWARGVRRIDTLLFSHAHTDHVGGAPFLLHAFTVAEVWEGPAALPDPDWRRLNEAVRASGATRRAVARGVRAEWDGVGLEILGPRPPRHPLRRVRNEDSIVLGVRLGDVAFLLAADVQGEAEQALALSPVTVVKVPHQGSRTASSPAFVRATRPRVAIVSVGRNPFGHPHPEVLERYRSGGALVLRTDRDGTVEVATDGQRVWLRLAGEAGERRIR
jgi:competence protein ComEC